MVVRGLRGANPMSAGVWAGGEVAVDDGGLGADSEGLVAAGWDEGLGFNAVEVVCAVCTGCAGGESTTVRRACSSGGVGEIFFPLR